MLPAASLALASISQAKVAVAVKARGPAKLMPSVVGARVPWIVALPAVVPEPSSRVPAAVVTLPVPPSPAMVRVPEERVVGPSWVAGRVRTSAPGPDFVREPEPARGSARVRVRPLAIVRVPPPGPRVTPPFGRSRVKLTVGWKPALSRVSWPARGKSGLPPSWAGAAALRRVPPLTRIAPVKLSLEPARVMVPGPPLPRVRSALPLRFAWTRRDRLASFDSEMAELARTSMLPARVKPWLALPFSTVPPSSTKRLMVMVERFEPLRRRMAWGGSASEWPAKVWSPAAVGLRRMEREAV